MTATGDAPPKSLPEVLGYLAKLIAKELAEELKPLIKDDRPEFVDRRTCPFSKRWWDKNAGKTFPVSRDGRRLIAKYEEVVSAFERQAKLAPKPIDESGLDEGERELVRAGIHLTKRPSAAPKNESGLSPGKLQNLREINDAINTAFGIDKPLSADMLGRLRKIDREEGLDALKNYFDMTEPPIRRFLDGLSPNAKRLTRKQLAASRVVLGQKKGLLEYNPFFLRQPKRVP